MAQFRKKVLLIILLLLSLSLVFAKGKRDKKMSVQPDVAPNQTQESSPIDTVPNTPTIKAPDKDAVSTTAEQTPNNESSDNVIKDTQSTSPDTNDFFYSSENNNPNNDNITQDTLQAPNGLNTFLVILRMIIILALVIAAIYGVMYVMRKSMKTEGVSDDPFLRRVSQINLGVGKSAQIITLLDKAYILGVTDNAVNLIAQVSDKELIDAMNLYSDDKNNSKKPRTFSDILKIFMPNGPVDKKDSDLYNDSKEKMAQLLKKQKARLQENNTMDEVDL